MYKIILPASLALLITALAIVTEWTGLRKNATLIQSKTFYDIYSLWPVWILVFIVSLSIIYFLMYRKK